MILVHLIFVIISLFSLYIIRYKLFNARDDDKVVTPRWVLFIMFLASFTPIINIIFIYSACLLIFHKDHKIKNTFLIKFFNYLKEEL